MSKIIVVMFLISGLGLAITDNCPQWQVLHENQGLEPIVNVLESSPEHFTLEITVPGFYMMDYPEGITTFQRLEVPEYFTNAAVGMPELPSIPVMCAIPENAEIQITVTETSSTIFHGITVYPTQEPEVDNDSNSSEFAINSEFYNGDQSYPLSLAEIDSRGSMWGGLPVSRLVLNPFIYNPQNGDLEVVSSFIVTIEYSGECISEYTINERFINSYEDMVINFSGVKQSLNIRETSDTTVKYLFISCGVNCDSWIGVLQEHLFDGLSYYMTSTRPPACPGHIKSLIEQFYLDSGGDLRFVVLVGSQTNMPPYIWPDGRYGDLYYGLLEGSDFLAEVAIGRILGDADQIDHQASKLLNDYVNYFTSTNDPRLSLANETVLCAHEQDYPGKYTQCCNQIAGVNYTYADIDFTTLFPPEGATDDQLYDIIEEGVGTVGYRGHGCELNWSWAPITNVLDVLALQNDFAPIVFNICCDNGDFRAYLPAGYDCMAETWQWAEHGASGNLAATSMSYTLANHTFMQYIYKYIYGWRSWVDPYYRIGEAINKAEVYMMHHHGGYTNPNATGVRNAKMYIWFGDPAQFIWTQENASSHFISAIPIDIIDDYRPENPLECSIASHTITTDISGTTVTVHLQMASESSVQISIFDMAGRVQRVEGQSLSAGGHALSVSTVGMANGVYLYQIEAGEEIETGKFVLFR